MKPEHQDHEGHRIEIRRSGEKATLLIDGSPVSYGQLPNGKFFLDNYAFDWTDDLMELARRYVSYREGVQKIKAKQIAKKAK